jgi:hypothetical protein
MGFRSFFEDITSDFPKIGPAYWNESLELLTICRRLIKDSDIDIEHVDGDGDKKTTALERLPSEPFSHCQSSLHSAFFLTAQSLKPNTR